MLSKFFLALFFSIILGNGLHGKDLEIQANCAGIDFECTQPLFVSLGSFCGPASTIKTAGLRMGAFPFDWMLSVDGEKIIEILEDNFFHFFEKSYLKPFVNGVLLQKYYHMEFSHEGVWNNQNFSQNFTDFLAKYQRRIERFRKLNNYKGKVFFMRQAWSLSTHPNYAFADPGNLEISIEYAQRLYRALEKFFPALDTYLIIINAPKSDLDVPIAIIDKMIMINSNSYNLASIAETLSQ